MLTTMKLLELIKSANSDCTDYRAAKILDVRVNTVSAWRRIGATMSDETAIKAAKLLDIDPDYVVACMHAERASSTPSEKIWKHIVKRLEPQKVAAVMAGFAVCYTAVENFIFVI